MISGRFRAERDRGFSVKSQKVEGSACGLISYLLFWWGIALLYLPGFLLVRLVASSNVTSFVYAPVVSLTMYCAMGAFNYSLGIHSSVVSIDVLALGVVVGAYAVALGIRRSVKSLWRPACDGDPLGAWRDARFILAWAWWLRRFSSCCLWTARLRSCKHTITSITSDWCEASSIRGIGRFCIRRCTLTKRAGQSTRCRALGIILQLGMCCALWLSVLRALIFRWL